MPLQHLQHFLIQTEDLEKTKDWYVDVLGMRVGPHPDFKFPVYWLYLGDDDVLHITQGGSQVSENRMKYLGQQSTATTGSGVVDHVAFRAPGLLDLIDHLKAKLPSPLDLPDADAVARWHTELITAAEHGEAAGQGPARALRINAENAIEAQALAQTLDHLGLLGAAHCHPARAGSYCRRRTLTPCCRHVSDLGKSCLRPRPAPPPRSLGPRPDGKQRRPEPGG